MIPNTMGSNGRNMRKVTQQYVKPHRELYEPPLDSCRSDNAHNYILGRRALCPLVAQHVSNRHSNSRTTPSVPYFASAVPFLSFPHGCGEMIHGEMIHGERIHGSKTRVYLRA